MNIDMGASLRVAQAKFKITGSELARSFKVHPQQVIRWRTGHDMKISLASNLSKYFGVTLSEFVAMGASNV
jgi:plasmid maintenance system antidote protein VapI